MQSLIGTIRGLGPARLAVMGGVAAAILAFFLYFAGRIAEPEMQLLYGDLEASDSAEIVSRLESAGVAYRLSPDGSRVMVPGDRVARLRLAMAEEGLPSGGSLGYEIFDRSEGFGSSSFMQNINHLRALEGELARSIRTLHGVVTARVHLVLPQRELFSRERNQPSASIVVTLSGNRSLAPPQVRAIQQLVAAAVPEMQPERVAIVDDRGNLLARTRDGNQEEAVAATVEERRLALENRLARQIETLLERSVGPGNVRAEVAAELNYDRITENAEIYDPDGQVVRSTQTVEETSRDSDASGNPPVSVANSLPNANLPALGETGSSSSAQRTEETVNYEISRTVKTHVREIGELKRLSVAVLVNGRTVTDESGKALYQPRSTEELEKLAALARSAVGLDPARGDTFEIANLAFAEVLPEGIAEPAAGGLFGFAQQDLLRIAELLVLGVVAVLVLLLVVRPLVMRLLERGPEKPTGPGLLGSDGGHQPALSAAEGVTTPQPSLLSGPSEARRPALLSGAAEEELGDQLIDIARVEGRVRASSVRKIGEIVEMHPEEAVSIVRNWLYQDS